MNKPASLLAIASFAAASLVSSAAFAQDYETPPAGVGQPPSVTAQARPFPDRQGVTGGFSLGAGHLETDSGEVDIGTTIGLSLRIGAAVTQSFLLQANLEAVRSADDETKVGAPLSFMGVSAVGYLHPRFYLIGGLGMARATVDVDGETVFASERAPGIRLGAGVEVYQSTNFGLSLEARFIAASFEEETDSGSSLQLGFQWW